MKLERINKKSSPGYPSFKSHKIGRRGALKTFLGGLTIALTSGCNLFSKKQPQVVGEMPLPTPPPANTNSCTIETKGEMPAPAAPEEKEKIPMNPLGRMPAPRENLKTSGDIALPVPPANTNKPAIRGKPAEPKPPEVPERPEIMGLMMVPEPPKSKKN